MSMYKRKMLLTLSSVGMAAVLSKLCNTGSKQIQLQIAPSASVGFHYPKQSRCHFSDKK